MPRLSKIVVTGFGLHTLFSAARFRPAADGKPPELWSDRDWEASDEIQRDLRDRPERREALAKLEHYERRLRGYLTAPDPFGGVNQPKAAGAVRTMAALAPQLGSGETPFAGLPAPTIEAFRLAFNELDVAFLSARMKDDSEEAFGLLDDLDSGEYVVRMSPSALSWITSRVQLLPHNPGLAGPRVRLFAAIRRAVDEDV